MRYLLIVQQQLLNKGHIPCLELFSRWGMATGEMERVGIMLQEQWLEMCQRIFFTEDAPYANLIIYITAVELMGFHLLELVDQLFVDGEVLLAVCPW